MSEQVTWRQDDAEALRAAIGAFVRAGRGHNELPPAQARTLGALDREGPMSIGELASATTVRHQSARETVASLKRDGLISTARSRDDARKTICTLTTEGRGRLDNDRRARTLWILNAMRRLSPEQQRAALDIASTLRQLAENTPPA